MNITQATIKDLEGLSILFNSYRLFYEQESHLDGARAFLRARIENNESVIFVAKDKQRYVGFIQLYPTFSSISMKRTWILNDLFVNEHSRNQGVGKLLLQKAKVYAIETDAVGLSLCTAKDNYSAQKLYEKHGYLQSQFYHYDYVLTK